MREILHVVTTHIVGKVEQMQNTVKLSGSNTDASFTAAISNSFLSPLEKNPVAAD